MYNIELGKDYPKPIVDLKQQLCQSPKSCCGIGVKTQRLKRENYRST